MGKEIFAYANPRRRSSSRRARGRKRTRGRRNPDLLALANPRRHRRGRRRTRKYFSFAMRARKNPGFGGRLPLVGVPVSDLVYNAMGAVGSSFVSSMAMKMLPVLAPNPLKPKDFLEQAKPYAVDFAVAFLIGQVGGMVFKSPGAKAELTKGALLNPLFRLLKTQIFPKLGLSGFGQEEFDSSDFDGLDFFEPDVGVGAFVPSDEGMSLTGFGNGFGQDPVLDQLMVARRDLYGGQGLY